MHSRLKDMGLWGRLHEESENLAMRAERALHSNSGEARVLYAQAAQKELEALTVYPDDKRHIQFYEALIVSAAALAVKGEDYQQARQIIDTYQGHIQRDFQRRRLQEVIDALPKDL